MATEVVETIAVRRAVDVVAKVATDPARALPLIGGFGRFQLIEQLEDGDELWDLFVDIGTIHVGGRLRVRREGEHRLAWESVRGTRQAGWIEVRATATGGTDVAMALSVEFAGLLTGALTEWLARGIVRRHLQAGLQQLRHHLEHEV